MFYEEPETKHLSVSYSSLEISFGVRYAYYFNKSSKLFTNIAFAGDLTHKMKTTIDNVSHDGETSESNLFFGIGYGYLKFSIETRFATDKNISGGMPISIDYKKSPGII